MTIKSMKFVDIDFNKFFKSLGDVFNFDVRGIYFSLGLGLIAGVSSYIVGNLIPMYAILGIVLVVGGLASIDATNGRFIYIIKIILLSILFTHLVVLKPLTSDKPLIIPVAIYTTNYEQKNQNDGTIEKLTAVKIYNRSTNELLDTIKYNQSDKIIIARLYNGVTKIKIVIDHTMFLNYRTHYEYIR